MLQTFKDIINLYYINMDKCTECHKVLETDIENVDTIDYLVVEYKIKCKHCGSVQDYFAYGNYEKDYYCYQITTKYPIISNMVGNICRTLKQI